MNAGTKSRCSVLGQATDGSPLQCSFSCALLLRLAAHAVHPPPPHLPGTPTPLPVCEHTCTLPKHDQIQHTHLLVVPHADQACVLSRLEHHVLNCVCVADQPLPARGVRSQQDSSRKDARGRWKALVSAVGQEGVLSLTCHISTILPIL